MEKADRNQFSKARLLVVGDVMLDRYWFGDTGRISPEAPVPVVQVAKIDERLGGAANVARNASALGAKTTILGVIGQDEAGKRVEQLLQESGVQSQLQADSKVPTTVKLRVIARQQQLIRLDFEETPSQNSLDEKLKRFESLLPQVDVVILSDYGKGALEQVSAMIALAKANKKLVLVDPKGDAYSKYKGATVLTPNRSELRQVIGQWSDEADLTKRAQSLRQELELSALLLTRSEEGMTLFTEKGTEHVRAQAREVFDVSGAGDTVIATLAVAMAAGWPLERAMALANRAGGIVVGKLGTATVSAEELQ
ncbi:MAG: D-glycero-beta-D-manno-heptose-7-phosphate kinase [Burkholderiales bacterium]|nr:D-glycero-beta-D-manno-heptose-7-phosphate kinase [Burkholderiales bacterium]NBP46684.1 D-glycero-beta-D-manno-heptose-7-phosphate kinase [Burkholderiaceae bacterium]NBV81083.1 D-glycero-beta-D-manno-heptose-7-phosphate kinase [Burkholderiaceae bacterium]